MANPFDYAQSVNEQYCKSDTDYVNLKERWSHTLQQLPIAAQKRITQRLDRALRSIERRFKHTPMPLPKSLKIPLSEIVIDTTIQRQLDPNWVIDILEKWIPQRTLPLLVGPLEEADDVKLLQSKYMMDTAYAVWEGQHTALVLYWVCIALELDPSEFMVPVCVYDYSQKENVRANFIAINTTEGKHPLEHIDIYRQKVFAVKVDNSKNQQWVRLAERQNLLEKYKLFLTAKKFNDVNQPGALTRVEDIMHDKKYSEYTIEKFGVYADEVFKTQARAINTKEFPIIAQFLQLAENDGIEYTNDEVRGLAQMCIKLFGADFENKFWDRANIAFNVAWQDKLSGSSRIAKPKFNKNEKNGGIFFHWQVEKSWKNYCKAEPVIPAVNIAADWDPRDEDLF